MKKPLLLRCLRILRWVVALVSLTAMVVVFTVPTVACHASWLTRFQLIPAIMAGAALELLVIAISVALFGRLYCSVVCPLGIAQDVVHHCVAWALPKRTAKPLSRIVCAVRWTVLVLFVLGAAFGLTGLIAPYGIFGRFLTAVVCRIGESSMLVFVWSIGLFVFVMAMTFVRARWWCNRVCPVGTFLGLFSRWAYFHVRVEAAKCVKCGLCAKRCDKGALSVHDDNSIVVDESQCVSCLDCVGLCRKDALKWR